MMNHTDTERGGCKRLTRGRIGGAMNTVGRALIALGTFVIAALAMPARAQSSAPAATAIKAEVPDDLAEGEVRKIDKENGKITVRHGEIRNLKMPPMTMVFQVRNSSLLDKVRVGEKVRFKAIDDGGRLTITELAPAK